MGGRGSSGGNAKESAVATANSRYESRSVEDMKQEERAYISRDITRANVSGDAEEIHSSLSQAPIGTVLTYSARRGATETFVKTAQDSWDRTFKHDRGFEHLDNNRVDKLSTRKVSTRLYEGRKFEDRLYDVKFRAGRTAEVRNTKQTVKITNRGMNSSVKSNTATPEKTIRAIDKSLTGSSVMTKMGSSSYRVDLSRNDASKKTLINKLKKAGFKQIGKTNSWAK